MSRLAARRWFVACVLFLALFGHLHGAVADEQSADNFESFLEPIRLHYDVPALAAILMHGDRMAGIGAVGYRKSGETTPVGRDDRWHLGSIGKSMTATMIARLVERGTLTWDLRVGDALGDAVPDMHIAYRAVTLEDLLAHRSGLVGAMTALEIWSGKLWRSTKAKADLRLDIATEALALPPRSTFHYSNAGYVIAGAMAERAAGEPWASLCCVNCSSPSA